MISGSEPVIYIVEDDDAVRDALAVLLESAGYAVAAFGSARDFLEGYRRGSRGCLLVDLDMPAIGGPELVGILVSHQIRLPAVLMSARMHNQRLVKHLPPGVVGLLEKPFGDDELLQRIELALNSPHTQ